MRLSVYTALLLLCSFRRSYGSHRLKLGQLNISGNRDRLEILETLISITNWTVNHFSIIFDVMDIVDDHFFNRFPNFGWKLYSNVNNNNLTDFSNVIIFTNDFYKLNETLGPINIRRMDSRSTVLVILRQNFGTLDEIRIASNGISAVMWNLDKTDVLYLVPCRGDILAMTYFPFVKNCQVGELEVLDIWRKKSFVKGAELFPDKMLDIRGCVQNHTVSFPIGSRLQFRREFTESGEIILGGVGGRLMAIVAQKMNINLQPISTPPESWPLVVEQVARGESLFAISGTVPLAGQTEFLDLDSGYMEESFAFGYVVGGYEVSWKNLVGPLSWKVWQYILYTCLSFCALILIANRCHRGEIIHDKLRILDGIGVFLGATQLLPRSYFSRYLFGMWIVYSYLINASYNSGLVSCLTTPNAKRDIETFEDLLEDGIDFGGQEFHRQFYNDPSDPEMMRIYNKFKIWSDDESMHLLLNRRGVTGLLRSYVHMYNSNLTILGNVRDQFRLLKDEAFTYQVPIAMRRGSPFTFGIRRYTSRAIEGGFREYWLKHYTRMPSTVKIGRTKKTPTVLSIEHFKGILYLHTVGLIFSCVILIGEIIFCKYYRNTEIVVIK